MNGTDRVLDCKLNGTLHTHLGYLAHVVKLLHRRAKQATFGSNTRGQPLYSSLSQLGLPPQQQFSALYSAAVRARNARKRRTMHERGGDSQLQSQGQGRCGTLLRTESRDRSEGRSDIMKVSTGERSDRAESSSK